MHLRVAKCLECLTNPDQASTPPNFRDSVLTKLVKDSLLPPAKTVMMICLHSALEHYWPSLNLLSFASKAFSKFLSFLLVLCAVQTLV